MSVATLDRRIVPALNTVKTPWGTRMIPIRELERFLKRHTEVASVEFHRGVALGGTRRSLLRWSTGFETTTGEAKALAKSHEA